MKKYARWVVIVTATVALPMLLLLPLSEAKRANKSRKTTDSKAARASIPNLIAAARPQGNRLVPEVGRALRLLYRQLFVIYHLKRSINGIRIRNQN
jgi:hypothetical protein